MTHETTTHLLLEAKGGSADAQNKIVARFRPLLSRWATGRLPPHARGLADTDDLVQMTLVSALKHLDAFEPRREGAFLAYLRRILVNRIRDEIRRANVRGEKVVMDEAFPGREPSPLEAVIGIEALEAYESALESLTELQREAVMLRLEFGYSFPQIAVAIESPSANAARMVVVRGLARLAEVMDGKR